MWRRPRGGPTVRAAPPGAPRFPEAVRNIHNLSRDSAVTLHNDTVHIDGLRISSPAAVAGAKREADRQPDGLDRWAGQIFEIGAGAADLASGALDLTALQTSLERFADSVNGTATAAATELRAGVEQLLNGDGTGVTAVTQRALTGLSTEVAALVAGSDAPLPAAVTKAVADVTGSALGEIHRALAAQVDLVRSTLASDNPASPLFALRADVLRTVEDTRAAVTRDLADVKALMAAAQTRRETMALTAVKGHSHEADVVALCESIALGGGDVCEATGTRTGAVPGAKTGDAVVTFAASQTRGRVVRLAVEAKDKALTPAQWRDELAAARKNRGCHAAIGVARGTSRMPGERLICVLDPLNIVVAWNPELDGSDVVAAAYQVIKAQAIAACLDQESEIDAAAVRGHLRDALQSLDGFDRLRRQTQAAARAANDATQIAEQLKSALSAQVLDALRLLEHEAGENAEDLAS